MNQLFKFVGGAVVASVLAVVLTVFVFGRPLEAAVSTGLIAAGVAVVIVYMNARESGVDTTTRREQS